MANILITASISTGLFGIQLDNFEWQTLEVNNVNVPFVNGTFNYQQQSPAGAINFIATADSNLVIVNPGTIIDMKGPNNSTYFLMISYSSANGVTTLIGRLVTFPVLIPGSLPSPQLFSQGRMTGTFTTIA
jgi:hypothetical protein